MTGALVRESFDVELWEERKVHDTPHGFFAKMMTREAARVSHDNAAITQNNIGLLFLVYARRGGHALSLSLSLLLLPIFVFSKLRLSGGQQCHATFGHANMTCRLHRPYFLGETM